MNIKNLIIFINICISYQNIINEGVYNIIWNNLYLKKHKNTITISNKLNHPSSFFRIYKINKPFEFDYYIIEEILSNNRNKLSYSRQKEIIFPKIDIIEYSLWNFIIKKNKKYIIRNKNNCYVIISQLNSIICEDAPFEKATEFDLIKIYDEVKESEEDNKLIEKEPIDVIIKYIDLRDKNLKRKDIHQIEKDYDNEELRYAIRSIFMNIPWIRKIFILMPNNKVRFLKDYDLIKEKIIYVKDRDILGYDSSNTNAFLFRYWKLKRFGISDNFIVMDDDYFIGKKLKKKDFFYVKNGKVVPAIVTSNFIRIYKNLAQKGYEIYKKKATKNKYAQNFDSFNYSIYLTYLFLFKIFQNTLKDYMYIPKFTHNAIPVNVNELREIYNLVYFSEYKSATLDSLYRHIGYIQFQLIIQSYSFIKYNKKIRHISNTYIKMNNSVLANYRYSLFCINTGDYKYSYLNYFKAKIVMEYLFPITTPYEIPDYSLSNLSFNITKSMEKQINNYDKIIKQFKIERKCIRILLLIMFFILLKKFSKDYYCHHQEYILINIDNN